MRFALIRAGVVENVIIAVAGYTAPAGFQAVQTDTGGPGWTYAGGTFSPPAEAPPPPPAVPAEVWTYQAKTVMALTTLESLGLSGSAFGLPEGASLYDAVLAAVGTLPSPARTAALIQLESAPGTRRDAPLLAALAEPLGLTPAMIDQLFLTAAAIP